MKRTPLKRRAPLKRKKGGLKRTPMKRGRRRPMLAIERKARDLFERAVLAKGPCVMSGRPCPKCDGTGGFIPCRFCDGTGKDRCDGTCDPHHVLPKERLKDLSRSWSKQDRVELIWDARNGVPVCRRHHGLLTTAARRLRAEEIFPEVIPFVNQYGLWALLKREVPDLPFEVLDVLPVRPSTTRQSHG